MFSITESFNNRDSTMPRSPPDSPSAVSAPASPPTSHPPYSPPSPHTPHTPHRNSSYLPEKDNTPVSPDSTIIGDRAPSPGLEPVRSDDETLKEAAATPYFDPPDKEFYDEAPKLDGYSASATGPTFSGKKRRPWLKWVIAGGVLIVIVAIALGVGLGVGLKKRSKPQSKEQYLSTVGAFNGSGIALASQSFDGTAFGSIVMYFQHHTGQIRSAQLNSEGEWKGGDATEVVAVDAKNGTPIAAVAYARNETARWHIYYINKNNTISEVINSNRTNVWAPGPLNKLGLTPISDRNVGLQACWYGSFYSDVAYKHSPVPGQDSSNYNNTDLTVGIHLWYGSGEDTFGSASWIYGDSVWTKQQDFKGYNPHAGVGCYSWGPGSVTYVVLVDKEKDEVNILWKDLNITKKETKEHPVHEWVKTNITIPAFQNSSLGFTNFLYVQNPDLSFSGFNISWDAENTAVPYDPDQQFVVNNGAKGLPGSHLSVTALPDRSGGDSLLAFYQTNGSDVTEFVRDFERGQWTSSLVPIPDG